MGEQTILWLETVYLDEMEEPATHARLVLRSFLNQKNRRAGLDLSVSWKVEVERSCEHGNELQSFIKCRDLHFLQS